MRAHDLLLPEVQLADDRLSLSVVPLTTSPPPISVIIVCTYSGTVWNAISGVDNSEVARSLYIITHTTTAINPRTARRFSWKTVKQTRK